MEKYAPGDYCVMNYQDYFEKPAVLQKRLADVLAKLELSPHKFDLSQVKPEYRFLGAEVSKESIDFEIPAHIAKIESRLYAEMQKGKSTPRNR